MAEYEPIIGKNVIETLTLGMYEDSRFIYREYVQNAADQIDIAVETGVLLQKNKGNIFITINSSKKSIIIEDNATGIKSDNVLQFLGDVARSSKDKDKRKGFRGIGRLGGLGYCEKLIFETSYKGESIKSTIILDAKQLKTIIADKNINIDASKVISVITSLKSSKELTGEHYFKVIMENVTNVDLLNKEAIGNYLSMVAPVPFDITFTFGGKISKHFNANNIVLDEYNVYLNKNKVYKAYKDFIVDKDNDYVSEILDVDFFNLRNVEELLAIGWYGISDSLNKKMSVNNIDRGFRIRKSNITIGSEHTLNKFFGDVQPPFTTPIRWREI